MRKQSSRPDLHFVTPCCLHHVEGCVRESIADVAIDHHAQLVCHQHNVRHCSRYQQLDQRLIGSEVSCMSYSKLHQASESVFDDQTVLTASRD